MCKLYRIYVFAQFWRTQNYPFLKWIGLDVVSDCVFWIPRCVFIDVKCQYMQIQHLDDQSRMKALLSYTDNRYEAHVFKFIPVQIMLIRRLIFATSTSINSDWRLHYRSKRWFSAGLTPGVKKDISWHLPATWGQCLSLTNHHLCNVWFIYWKRTHNLMPYSST